ncbi:MAG: PD-(D/E)XK motif protein [Candidatus Thermoplasmatota archaeon]
MRDLESIWKELEGRYAGEDGVYRRLDLAHETGIRMAVLHPGRTWAILVEVSPEDVTSLIPPRWRGMGVSVLPHTGPVPSMKHICLYVEALEHRPVFTALCTDIIRTLESSSVAQRMENLQQCFLRWSRFFERWNQEGMTLERQRGLLGELEFLDMLLRRQIPIFTSVSSWKGCDGGVHDFALGRNAIEVKTTVMKEPRKVRINSERQLDDGHLESLVLFVVTLQETEANGVTLPDKISELRKVLENDMNAASLFETHLISSGYVDSDAEKYTSGYVIKKKESFAIKNGFPRIVSLPSGLGDLQYTLTLSACEPYRIDIDEMMNTFTEGAGR